MKTLRTVTSSEQAAKRFVKKTSEYMVREAPKTTPKTTPGFAKKCLDNIKKFFIFNKWKEREA